MAKVHILPSPMAYNHHKLYENANHEAQCVELIKQLLHAPPGTMWVEGAKITRLKPGEKDPIAPGTPIATFIDGRYPDWTNTGHAAIYLYQDQIGIHVLDQWDDHDPHHTHPWLDKLDVSEHIIYWAGGHPDTPVNNGHNYSVILW